MRDLITERFTDFCLTLLVRPTVVAILGGSSNDPEVGVINNLFPEARVYFFNLENTYHDANFQEINLNNYTVNPEHKSYFDLIVSSQVLEHIWNHENYFQQISNLCKVSGSIWISCPKSNMVHGSPEFFSSGFTATYLVENLKKQGLEIREFGELGNKRDYLAIHLARYWQTSKENIHPLLHYRFQPGSKKGVAWKFLRDFPTRLFLETITKGDAENGDYATQAYVAARKQV